MEKIKYTIIILVSLWSISSHAQQTAQYSMYMFNKYQYNNAYNGLDASLSMTGVFRKQWLGFDGTPISANFNAHLPLEYISSGIGLGVEYDVIGAYQNLSLKVSYSYILDLGEGKLSLGIAGRFLQKSLDGSKLITPNGDYGQGVVLHRDPRLSSGRENGTNFSVDLGIYYKHPKFEVGLSTTHLTAPKLSLATDVGVVYNRTYFLTGAYNWQLTDKFLLQPNFLLKTDFVKFQPEIAAILKYDNNIFGGVAFRGYDTRSIDAVVFLAGMQITPNILLAYSYDWSIGSLQTFNNGSHELVLNYNLNKKIGKEIPAKVIYNPRFL